MVIVVITVITTTNNNDDTYFFQQYWIQIPLVSAADMTDRLFKGDEESMEAETVEDTWKWSVHVLYLSSLCKACVVHTLKYPACLPVQDSVVYLGPCLKFCLLPSFIKNVAGTFNSLQTNLQTSIESEVLVVENDVFCVQAGVQSYFTP